MKSEVTRQHPAVHLAGAAFVLSVLVWWGGAVAEESSSESEASEGEGPGSVELRPYATLADENQQVDFEAKRRMLEDAPRVQRLQPVEVVKRLGVEPGMSTLEIGAGSGLFAFAMAEAVGPGGSAFATEILAEDAEWLAREGKRRGLSHFQSVRVGPGADDPFYASHRFDLVLLSSVLEYLPDPVDYFRTLRPRLTPDTGRVVLIQGRFQKFFLAEDFVFGFRRSDFMDLPGQHPVRAAIPADLLRGLEAVDRPSLDDPALRERLATAFNDLLASPALFLRVLAADRSAGLDPEESLRSYLRGDELELWRWLHGSFDWKDADRVAAWSDPRQQAAATELNFLCLVRWLRRGEMSLRFNAQWAFYLSDPSIVRRMEAAGYQLQEDGRDEQGRDLLPNHSFLVFGVAPTP